MNIPEHSQLGKTSTYVDQYTPDLLYPLSRSTQRQTIGVGDKPLFVGADLWTAYELSWLNMRGKPQIAMARMVVPCESTHLVESKSLKLYLNSFNNTRFADASAVRDCVARDLSQAVWSGGPMHAGVGVVLVLPEQFEREPIHELDGLSLDRLDIECDRYQPALRPAALCRPRKPCHRNPDQQFAQKQLSGDRPARLGQCAHQLQRAAN